MSDVISSRLWKAAQLGLHSAYFASMVQAACWYQGKEYTTHLLNKIATTQALLDALAISPGESVDTALLEAMIKRGQQIDQVIMSAVSAYVAPAEPI